MEGGMGTAEAEAEKTETEKAAALGKECIVCTQQRWCTWSAKAVRGPSTIPRRPVVSAVAAMGEARMEVGAQAMGETAVGEAGMVAS